MSGLGDLAVVDLLEGVEALARGRHGVHQMHGGGSCGGIEICGVGLVRRCLNRLVARAIFLSHEPGAISNLRRKSGAELPRLWLPEVSFLEQLYQMPTTLEQHLQ